MEQTKRCPDCEQVKPVSEFGKDTHAHSGLRSHCRVCMKVRNHAGYMRNPKARIEYTQRWRANNLGQARAQLRRRQWAIKQDVMDGYGGACACCGEDGIEFLVIDHPLRNGKADRAKGLFGANLYKKLIKEGFPTGYRALCANCNQATKEGDPCPHEAEAISKLGAVPTYPRNWTHPDEPGLVFKERYHHRKDNRECVRCKQPTLAGVFCEPCRIQRRFQRAARTHTAALRLAEETP